MKKAAIILGVCAVAVIVVLMLPRSRESRTDPGTVREKAEAETEETNPRSRSQRESGAEGEEESISPSSSGDPQTALAEAAVKLKDPERSIAIADILGTWAETDPLAALAWVEESGPGRENPEDLRAHILFTWSGNKPEAAATWLEENPGMQQPANLLALLGPWMDNSPEAAVAWSTTKLQTVQREGILADLLVSCGSEENALALLGEVDPVVADDALQAAVTSIADEDPELAKKLSALITGPLDSTGEKPQLDSVSPATGNGSDE